MLTSCALICLYDEKMCVLGTSAEVVHWHLPCVHPPVYTEGTAWVVWVMKFATFVAQHSVLAVPFPAKNAPSPNLHIIGRPWRGHHRALK